VLPSRRQRTVAGLRWAAVRKHLLSRYILVSFWRLIEGNVKPIKCYSVGLMRLVMTLKHSTHLP
jgi:hypothetical protein